MRYILKTDAPDFFVSAVQNVDENSRWSSRKIRKIKKRLNEHIRNQEQKGICAYCEIRISPGASHVEHIRPQQRFPESRFDYNNLIVSCNGYDCRADEEDEEWADIHSCGHKKSSEFDESLFLSPVIEKDIADYFRYDKETGRFLTNQSRPPHDLKRADYTRKLLHLDNSRLNKSRRDARKALEKELQKFMADMGAEKARRKLNGILSEERENYPSFMSFLRFCFQRQLMEKRPS